MIDFILFIIGASCFIPLIFAGAGIIGWRTAGILTPIFLFMFFFGMYWASVYMDSLWFDNLGYHDTFWKMFSMKWTGFVVAALVVYILARLAFWGAERSVLQGRTAITSYLREISCVALALVFGLIMYGQWNGLVLFLNGGSFGTVDPIFHKDVGFYVFQLQFYNTISGLLLWALVAIGAISGIFCLYYVVSDECVVDVRKMIRFACLFGVAVFGTIVWMRFLANYSYLFSTGGVIYGVGYADMVRIAMNRVLIGFLGLSIVLLVIAVIRPRLSLLVSSVVTPVAVCLIFLVIVPVCVQSFVVSPNEFQKEQPYIENNIDFTREAYNLKGVGEKEFTPSTLTGDVVGENEDTLGNVRIWDWRALLPVYEQLQSFRLYYTFPDVDIDRYVIDGEYRQVMLASREIDPDRLAEKTWVNTRLIYTHGYGVVMNEVNASENGVPVLLVKNIPPASSADGVEITRPGVYYGDYTGDYVIAPSDMREFDYPMGDENTFSSYDGQGGVEINSFVRRLSAAIKFGDINILLTGQINYNSKLIWNRDIKTRVDTLAPYLMVDADNYMVVRPDGTLVWLQDTYTTSKHYPYSTPQGDLNYVRNSVKVVVDAYSGDTALYVFDGSDPVVNAYRRAFPSLFQDGVSMPSDLVSHIRYPEDMLSVQARVYMVYHMTDPMVFYNKEDVWVFPTEILEQGIEQQVIPYYVIIRLPDTGKEEFLQMIPFTPSGKQNAIGWMAGLCDGENYSKLVVYKFPKQTLVYGPMQFEALVNQDDEMASQFTLWTKTSTVIRGNTLIIPLGDSLIYVEPVYLRSETARMPQLVKVIVGGQDVGGDLQVAWGSDVTSAVNNLLGVQAIATPSIPHIQVEPSDLTDALQALLARLEALRLVPLQDSPGELESIIAQIEAILAGAE
jgi:uncharacterized membrane protein (UPF0182 family)